MRDKEAAHGWARGHPDIGAPDQSAGRVHARRTGRPDGAALVSLALATLGQSWQRSRMVRDGVQLRQNFALVTQYAQDHRDTYPVARENAFDASHYLVRRAEACGVDSEHCGGGPGGVQALGIHHVLAVGVRGVRPGSHAARADGAATPGAIGSHRAAPRRLPAPQGGHAQEARRDSARILPSAGRDVVVLREPQTDTHRDV